MSTTNLLRRIVKLEAADDGDILLFDEERLLPDGTLELHNRRLGFDGGDTLVAVIPAREVEAFRRRVIRLRPARGYHGQD